jgi:ABC-type multidrug transport system fused ATPase/permease subunit
VLARADRVLVFDDGRLVADAHHSVLVQGDGPYARAWRLQQAAEALEGAP